MVDDSTDTQFAVEQMQKLGVPDDVQPLLMEKISRGETLESEMTGAAPQTRSITQCQFARANGWVTQSGCLVSWDAITGSGSFRTNYALNGTNQGKITSVSSAGCGGLGMQAGASTNIALPVGNPAIARLTCHQSLDIKGVPAGRDVGIELRVFGNTAVDSSFGN
ncbi:hypothetical protein JT358_10605 [Micrococcales bacterium 31B]|nr:hypothetical protein [Micrococcales bacterium 31B]